MAINPPLEHDRAFIWFVFWRVPTSFDSSKCHFICISPCVSSDLIVDHPWPPVIDNRIVERPYPSVGSKVRHCHIVITTEDERRISIDTVILMVWYAAYNVICVRNTISTSYPFPYTLLIDLKSFANGFVIGPVCK